MSAEDSGPSVPPRFEPRAGLGREPRPALPKRFFARAHAEPKGEGYALLLDGRPAKTPARRALTLPTQAAAIAVAEEWNGLGEIIDPHLMPMTRTCNATIDGVAEQMTETAAEVAKYLQSDLLVYRAGAPDSLVAAQNAAWDPVLAWCRESFGARFILAQGLVFVAQPPATLSAMEAVLQTTIGTGAGAAFRLAAINIMTVLTGSALLALAVMHERLTDEAAWASAHIDEIFQEGIWGADAEALARRAARWQDMRAAARLGLACCPPTSSTRS